MTEPFKTPDRFYFKYEEDYAVVYYHSRLWGPMTIARFRVGKDAKEYVEWKNSSLQ